MSGRKWTPRIAAMLFILSLPFFMMIPFSYTNYASFGFDWEYLKNERVVEDFYRIRWPGDGSFRIGAGSILYSPEEEDVDTVDLAARFLEPRQFPLTSSSWYRIAVVTGLDEGDEGRLDWSTWLIVPSWLPFVLLAIYPVVWFWRKRRRLDLE